MLAEAAVPLAQGLRSRAVALRKVVLQSPTLTRFSRTVVQRRDSPYREYGIRVIDLFPGATRTPIWDDLWPEAPRERMMAPRDVADAVLSAVVAGDGAMVEEIVLRPQGGDL